MNDFIPLPPSPVGAGFDARPSAGFARTPDHSYPWRASYPVPASRAAVVVKVADILRLAENYAYTQAHALKDLDPALRHEYSAKLTDIAQEYNLPMVADWIEQAIGELSSLVSGYQRRGLAPASIYDSSLSRQDEYLITLRAPATLPQSSLHHIARQMLQYLADRLLEEYTSLTLPERTQLWAQKAEAARERICDALKERTSFPLIKTDPW